MHTINEPTYAQFVKKLFATKESTEEDVLHAVIGMITEWQEYLDRDSDENEAEELGDFGFYLQAFLQCFPSSVSGELPFPDAPEPTRQSISTLPYLIDMLDICKKLWVYGKPLEEVAPKLRGLFNKVFVNYLDIIEQSAKHREIPAISLFYEIVEYNKEKLSKRYPDKIFSFKDALERKDKLAGE